MQSSAGIRFVDISSEQNSSCALEANGDADVAGSYSSPAALGAGERFGYTYRDSTASSSVSNPASANFAALTSTNRAVMGSTVTSSGSGCVSFDAQASATTPADSYSATIVYIAVPTF